jgi:hypothetical protein
MFIYMRVLSKDVVPQSTAQPHSADQTHPEPLTLVALLAEFDDGRLLVVSAEGTDYLLPLRETFQVEVVTTEDGN